MAQTTDLYRHNPLIHRDRRLGSSASAWVRSFACTDLKPLIVCRGPIRKEAMDVFEEMGITHYGILLSEKDSIVYPNALAPELRQLTDNSRIHRVPDYTGASKEDRVERMNQIVQIAKDNGYDSVFAGYGFMAEDEEFVATIERAGLTFIGPNSVTQARAGKKDEAKRTALDVKVSVTPGINNVTAKTLVAKHKTREALVALVRANGLEVDAKVLGDAKLGLEELADAILMASYAKGIDLYTIDELGEQVRKEVVEMFKGHPQSRVRLKAIGGGGGKGQRILGGTLLTLPNADQKAIEAAAAEAPALTREVLNEVKATGVGDNKNVLIELNIEQTRHNEIQLLGNGEWCVTLGGRDCSLQMHEQKLVEVSVTQEGLAGAVARAREAGDAARAGVLATDLGVLQRMEAEAERFGLAVKLDSASTFECIVEGDRHYFMEVNTRIQVEHRVSELCYALRFANPDDPTDHFDVHSLVEAMALIAKHKTRLPKPTRVQRDLAALEVRLNATDRALQPAAGGVIVSWSDPVPGEIRDDQGISLKNPDTGLFMRYRLAGAYDSNIALLLATGGSREESWSNLLEVLRRTTIRGIDLSTNHEFLYGIMHWFAARDPWAKPTTKFVVPYLTLVGQLAQEARAIDLEYAFHALEERAVAGAAPEAAAATQKVFDLKETLVERPIRMLFEEPHYLSAWLSQHRHDYAVAKGHVVWKRNPIEVLADTYRLLHLDDPDQAAADRIWDHDAEMLDTALAFYARLAGRVPAGTPWAELDKALRGEKPHFGLDADAWERVRAAHVGHQLGLEILAVVPLLGERVGFHDLRLEDDLQITIPERLLDPQLQDAMKRVLVPPPEAAADVVVAAMGGMFYNREAPTMPLFVEPGAHFEKGQPLYIIEVMKMFNKVYAPFAGTVDEVLVKENGVIVRKGQPLFRVTPDEQLVEEDPELRRLRIRAATDSYLEKLR